MAARNELIGAVADRYRRASRAERSRILDEFSELTGYHRKHAIRVLCGRPGEPRKRPPRNRVYDEAVRAMLVVLWETSDRLCGKRLRALLPQLIEAMERHGHIDLDAMLRSRLLSMSAATIDRALSETRAKIDGQRRRRTGVGAAIRRSIPVRTFSDWGDPLPGFFEVDMVEHCGGPKTDGNYVHTLVLTDIASGWTECVAMPVRNQLLIVEAISKVASDLHFPMRGVDTDNDSAFMNETVFEYCRELGLQQTRSRAYKKNDQAWVEQKNGSIVRRLVGYGRLSGLSETKALARLYDVSRLYVNFFQPSFKLKSKTRDGARVHKKYHAPLTPCDRLLASEAIGEDVKNLLREQFSALDPVRLLQEIRTAQQTIADLAGSDRPAESSPRDPIDVTSFLSNLSKAWQEGEVRPTHRKRPGVTHWWRSRVDPFEHTWPLIEQWLNAEPTLTATQLMARLAESMPDVYAGTAQLRTLQRRINTWRQTQAKALILGSLERSAAARSGAASAAPDRAKQAETTT